MNRGRHKGRALTMVVVLFLSQIIYIGHTEFLASEQTVSHTANIPPVIEVIPDISRGKAPLVVHFDGDLYDEDGEVLSLEWDFEGDGVFEFSKDVEDIERPQRLQALQLGLQKEHIYSNPGITMQWQESLMIRERVLSPR